MVSLLSERDYFRGAPLRSHNGPAAVKGEMCIITARDAVKIEGNLEMRAKANAFNSGAGNYTAKQTRTRTNFLLGRIKQK